MITINDLVGAGVRPYFKIDISKSGFTITEKDLKKLSLSLSITEKEREYTMCSLQLKDVTGLYDKLCTYGVQVSVTMGIEKMKGFTYNDYRTYLGNEISGKYSRDDMRFHVMSASPILRDGNVYTTLNLRAGSMEVNDRKTRTFNSGTVGKVIQTLVDEIGGKLTIDFPAMDDKLDKKNQLNQNNETNMAMLYRLAGKYNTKLVYQHDPNFKQYVVYVIDWAKEKEYKLAELRGLKGAYHYFDYGTKNSNIIGGNFDTNNSTPLGSTAELRIGTDGKLILISRPSGQESAIVYTLNEAKIKEDLKKGNFADQTQLLSKVLASDTEDFTKTGGLRDIYFKRDTQLTAPEGYGWTADFDVVANPLYQVGDRAVIGMDAEISSIPPRFKTRYTNKVPEYKTTWRITQIVHNMSADGYTMKVTCSR